MRAAEIPGRFMVTAAGSEYVSFNSLADATGNADGCVILEGDDGGIHPSFVALGIDSEIRSVLSGWRPRLSAATRVLRRA